MGLWDSYSYRQQKREIDDQLQAIHRVLDHGQTTDIHRLHAHAQMQNDGRLTSKQLPLSPALLRGDRSAQRIARAPKAHMEGVACRQPAPWWEWAFLMGIQNDESSR
jgi:hypothetical protein